MQLHMIQTYVPRGHTKPQLQTVVVAAVVLFYVRGRLRPTSTSYNYFRR